MRECGTDTETFDGGTFVAGSEGGAVVGFVLGEDDECERCGLVEELSSRGCS